MAGFVALRFRGASATWRAAGFALALGLFAAARTVVAAQGYPQLHVIALSQRADRASVAPGDVFHVTVHVRVAQQRDRLDELILGTFANCEIISNETVRTAGPGGTDFVERLALQALAPGEATISPAYIDAIDPALGKAMRFSSNPLRVHVTGAVPLPGPLRSLASAARRLVLAVSIVAGIFAAVFVLGAIFLRRRKRRPTRAPAPVLPAGAPAPVAPLAPREQLLRVADAYRASRSDASLAEVRGVLFTLAGVARGATLVDALRMLGDDSGPLRFALLAAERALFGPSAERFTAGDEMLAAIQAYHAARPAKEDAWIR